MGYIKYWGEKGNILLELMSEGIFGQKLGENSFVDGVGLDSSGQLS